MATRTRAKSVPTRADVHPPDRTLGIVGAGSWGTTLAAHVTAGGHGAIVWDVDKDVVREMASKHVNSRSLRGHELPPAVRATSDLAELAAAAQVIALAVPSTVMRSVLEKLGP